MKKTVLFFAFLTLTITSVFAQGSSEMQPRKIRIDLDTALEIALSENSTIKIADMEIERKDYVRQETASNLYPSLSVSGQYSYAVKQQKTSKDSDFSMGADNTITATAQLNVPLFVPSVYPTLKLNKMDILVAVESARSSRQSLVNEVKKAYYNLLLAEQSLSVLLASQATIQETVDNTRLLYDNELESEYSLLTAEVQLSNLKPSIVQARSSIDVATLYMKMLLELPEDVELEVAGDLDDFAAEMQNVPLAFTTDVSENTNLKLLDLQADMLRQQVKIINAGRLPTVSAFGTLTAYGNDNNLDFSALVTGGSMTNSGGIWWQWPASVGVNISIPVFNGFAKNKQVKQTKNSLAQLELQRSYTERQLYVQAETSVSNMITARESMAANEKTMQQAEKAYDITKSRYTAGLGTILELNSAELSLTQSRLSYSQSIYNYLAAYADYELSIGIDYIRNESYDKQ